MYIAIYIPTPKWRAFTRNTFDSEWWVIMYPPTPKKKTPNRWNPIYHVPKVQNLIKGKCKRKTQTDRKIVLSSNVLKTRNSNPSIFQEPLEKNQNVFIMNQTNKQRMKRHRLRSVDKRFSRHGVWHNLYEHNGTICMCR